MNRRQFLASLGIGAPAAVLAAKMGLLERVRSYFFAPKRGWIFNADPARIDDLTLEHWGRIKLDQEVYDFDGMTLFPVYGADGGLSKETRVAYLYCLPQQLFEEGVISC